MASGEVEPTDVEPGTPGLHPERINIETRIYRAAAAEAAASGDRLSVLLAPYCYPDLASLGAEDGGPPHPTQ